jgi:hypothetical protein
VGLDWDLNGPANVSCIESSVKEQTADPAIEFLREREIGRKCLTDADLNLPPIKT